jgi:hypothetical protein
MFFFVIVSLGFFNNLKKSVLSLFICFFRDLILLERRELERRELERRELERRELERRELDFVFFFLLTDPCISSKILLISLSDKILISVI